MLELKFSIQNMLLHQYLKNEEDVMWFLVMSNEFRFNQDELGLIIDLGFGLIS